MINEEKRIAAMKEYFTSDELSMIYWSLQLLGQHYEDKANGLVNKTGMNTKYKQQQEESMREARKLAAIFS